MGYPQGNGTEQVQEFREEVMSEQVRSHGTVFEAYGIL